MLVTAGTRAVQSEAAWRWMHFLSSYRQSPETTLRTYRGDIKRFLGFLAQSFPEVQTPGDVTRLMVMQYALSLGGMAPRSIRRRLACVSSFLNFLCDMGEIEVNPATRIPLPKVPQTLPRGLKPETVRAVIAAARTPRERCLVLLLATTGIRRAEAAGIRLSDLDLPNRQVLIRGKGAKERMLPLLPETIAAIRAYLSDRNDGNLFLTQDGRAIRGYLVGLILDRVVKRSGLEGKITPHAFRHTFATQLIRAGVDVRTIQELLGHSDLKTTALYLHADTRSKEAAVVEMSAVVFRQAGATAARKR